MSTNTTNITKNIITHPAIVSKILSASFQFQTQNQLVWTGSRNERISQTVKCECNGQPTAQLPIPGPNLETMISTFPVGTNFKITTYRITVSEKMVSPEDWFDDFVKSHPELQTLSPEALSQFKAYAEKMQQFNQTTQRTPPLNMNDGPSLYPFADPYANYGLLGIGNPGFPRADMGLYPYQQPQYEEVVEVVLTETMTKTTETDWEWVIDTTSEEIRRSKTGVTGFRHVF